MTVAFSSRRTRVFGAGAGVVGLSLLLAACGGSAAASGNRSAAPSASPSRSGRGGGAGKLPAASGTIAAVSSGSFEVQNPAAGQTTVTYTASTTFTHSQPGSLAGVAAGACIQVVGQPGATTGSPLTATAITTSAAANGSCHSGARSSAPKPRASSSRSRPPRRGAVRLAGTVTSVSGATIVLSVPAHGSAPAGTRTVNTTSATKFMQVSAGSASDLAVGQCAAAFGKAGSTGTVAANRIAISAPGASGCTGNARASGGSVTPGA